jgi:four helix bundle protein
VSNNIAEGSGSNSTKEVLSFLNISRRLTFENANILIVMEQLNLVNKLEVTLLSANFEKLTWLSIFAVAGFSGILQIVQ